MVRAEGPPRDGVVISDRAYLELVVKAKFTCDLK